MGATVVRPARRSVRSIFVENREGPGQRDADGDGDGDDDAKEIQGQAEANLREGKGKENEGKEIEDHQIEVQIEVDVERATVVLHRPHGGPKAWCHRNVLENMAGALMGAFGWESGDFVLREP